MQTSAHFLAMFKITIIYLLILSINSNENYAFKWSSCSERCQPGYKYYIRANDQLIELHSCFEQDFACKKDNYEKIKQQKKIIQESRRQYLSKTLIQIIILLSVAIGLTIVILSICFKYLFREIYSLESDFSIMNFIK